MTIVSDHFKRVRETLLRKGEEVQLARHTTVAGTARELVLREFLTTSFPGTCEFLSGEIVDSDDKRSGQVDLIVTPRFAPRLMLAGDHGIALSDGTIAAIEVKSTLTTGAYDASNSFNDAMATVSAIRSLRITATPWPWESNKNGRTVRLHHIPVAIVAFEGPTETTLLEKLAEYHERNGPDALPNTVTVLKRNYTLIRTDDWYFANPPDAPKILYSSLKDTGACVADLYFYLLLCTQSWTFRNPFTPLASYLNTYT